MTQSETPPARNKQQQPFDVEAQQKRVYNASGSRSRETSSNSKSPPVVIDGIVRRGRGAKLLARAPETRPPPGLFQNAISQIAGSASNSPRPQFPGSKAPPGLSPIPLHPISTTTQTQTQQQQHHHQHQQQERNIASQGLQQPPQQPKHVSDDRHSKNMDTRATSKGSSQNPIVIHINIELESGGKVPVPLRLHDDPEMVAREFIAQHGITQPYLIQALMQLFINQKQLALKKRHV